MAINPISIEADGKGFDFVLLEAGQGKVALSTEGQFYTPGPLASTLIVTQRRAGVSILNGPARAKGGKALPPPTTHKHQIALKIPTMGIPAVYQLQQASAGGDGSSSTPPPTPTSSGGTVVPMHAEYPPIGQPPQGTKPIRYLNVSISISSDVNATDKEREIGIAMLLQFLGSAQIKDLFVSNKLMYA